MNNLPPPERIATRKAELGEGFAIARALPTAQRRTIGAWCFLDRIGPVNLGAGQGLHVGAHPHTALQTFTWMIEGEILHRDSLGSEQVIRPGQINLMTAGHGIAHTEDSLPDATRLHAAQLWIALPPAHADGPAAFAHYPVLPRWTVNTVDCTLLAGRHGALTAPTQVYTPLLGMDVHSASGGTIALTLDPTFEHGVLTLTGDIAIDAQPWDSDSFAYLPPGRDHVSLQLGAGSRCLLLGGAPVDFPVVMWWNFVGPSREAIIAAQREWDTHGPRFGDVPGGTERRIAAPPLPWTG